LPMAMALELMAEVVAQGWQEFELTAVKEMHVLRGIILENGPKPIRVAAKPLAGSLAEQLEVEVSILGTENYGQVHYRATAELAKRIPAPIEFKPRSMVEARPFPMSVQEAYRQLLFHGPQFQRIDHIEKIGTSGIAASIVSSTPRQCVASTAQRKWLIDPMIIDNGLQLILIWARVHWDTTPLPSRFLRYRRFASSFASKVDCHVYIRPNSNNHIIHADLAFFHPEGHLMGLLEDIEAVCSRSLNLFTGSHVQYKGV